MPPEILASIISGGAGFVNQANSARISREQMELQQMYNEKNMAIQHNMNLQYMAVQDALNSPAHQRQLLEDAGFNASLMLKDNPNMGVSQPSSPSGGMPQPGDIPSLLQSLLTAEQIKGKRIENDYAPSLNEANLKKLDQESKKIAVERDFTSEQLDIVKKTAPYVIGKSLSDWQEVQSRIENIQASTEKIKSEKEFTDVHTEVERNLLDFEQFRTKWRKDTGLDYNDDNIYSALYGLYKTGKLTETFQAIGDSLKSVLGGSSDSNVESDIINYLDKKGNQALHALPDWLKRLIRYVGFDLNQ